MITLLYKYNIIHHLKIIFLFLFTTRNIHKSCMPHKQNKTETHLENATTTACTEKQLKTKMKKKTKQIKIMMMKNS